MTAVEGATDFCPQCHRDKPLEQFISRSGKRFVRQCIECRDRYQGWKTLSPEERLERMLTRYKASKFASGWSEHGAVLMFEAAGKRVRFDLPMPDPKDAKFTRDPRSSWRQRPAAAAHRAYEQECRARWRALALVIKAKLEAVESGITTFEAEFLAHIMLPDGGTFGEWAAKQLAQVYESGSMPPMLPGLGGTT